MSQYTPQYAKMEVLSLEPEGTEAVIRCACGEVFTTDAETKENIERDLAKCPACFSLFGSHGSFGKTRVQ